MSSAERGEEAPLAYERSGGAVCKTTPSSSARCCNASIASETCGDVNAGTRGLNIPAFSRAIFANVSPSTSTWSKPSDVTPHTVGDRTRLVASSLPPRPTSRIAHSTFSCAKIRKPNKVKNRKYAGGPPRSAHFERHPLKSHQNSRTKVFLETGAPSIRNRSRTSTRCGDVYRPVFTPHSRMMCSANAHVLPLPFVPATWIARSASTSSVMPSRSRYRRRRSN